MTDFHSHVLPKMDDGAKSVEVASKMLLLSKEQGVTTVLATSHYYGKQRSPEDYLSARNNSYELLKPHIPEGVSVKLGAEVYFSERSYVDFDKLMPLCIEGTNYLLIELPFVKNWEESLYQKLADLIAETGCAPVLAHVDRYAAFFAKPKRLLRFLEMGCLIQVNTDAFFEKSAKGFALALLKKGYVHALGTDMHDCDTRAPSYAKAKAVVEEAGLLAEWEKAQACMQKMISGERVEAEMPAPIQKFFGKFR